MSGATNLPADADFKTPPARPIVGVMGNHGKQRADDDRRYAAASIYCLYEEGVPTHVGQTTEPVELRAEEHRRRGEPFTSYSTLESLENVRMEEIEAAERRWSNRLGMGFEPKREGAASAARSAVELLCVLATALLLCF